MQIPTELWEATGAVQVLQTVGRTAQHRCLCTGEVRELLVCGLGEERVDEAAELDYASAYRQVDRSAAFYSEVLAAVSRVDVPRVESSRSTLEAEVYGEPEAIPALVPLHWSGVQQRESSGIILAPFALKPELSLPTATWQVLVRTLRTYGQTVYLMAERGVRFDYLCFTESEILSELPVAEKLGYLEAAKLIVGVPNAWLWAATAWEKKIITLLPDSIPPRRWFGFAHPTSYGVVRYDSRQLAAPVLLSAVRMLIDRM